MSWHLSDAVATQLDSINVENVWRRDGNKFPPLTAALWRARRKQWGCGDSEQPKKTKQKA